MLCKKCKNYSDENDYCVAIEYSPIGAFGKNVDEKCENFEEGLKSGEVIIGEIQTRLMFEKGWIR